MNIRQLASLGSVTVLLAAVGCGGGGSGGTGGAGVAGSPGKAGASGAAGMGAAGNSGTAGAGAAGNSGTAGAGAAGNSGTAGAGAAGNSGTAGQGGTLATDYSFSISPTALSLPLGGMQTVTVSIDRNATATTFTLPIAFTLLLPNTITGSGVTATFTPSSATLNSTTLTLNVGTTGITPGMYSLEVVGTAGTGATAETYSVPLPLTVTPPATTLLVDNDGSDNNKDPTDTTATPSDSDTDFASLLTGESINYQTFVVPADGAAKTPTTADLKNYKTVIWYTGEYYGTNTTLSDVQEAILADWLDQGGHTLIMLSENLVYDRGDNDWDTTPETDEFLADYIGAMGDMSATGELNHMTYTATGATGTPFAGQMYKVIKDAPLSSDGDLINPTTGTNPPVVLVTVPADPAETGTPIAAPIVVGRTKVGAAATSSLVYVGMPIENILMTSTNNSDTQLFHAILVYLGLKAS